MGIRQTKVNEAKKNLNEDEIDLLLKLTKFNRTEINEWYDSFIVSFMHKKYPQFLIIAFILSLIVLQGD
jgi:hypothetical protein